MTVAVQIRDVPEDVRDALTAEARRRGQSVQAYLLALVEHEARAVQNAAAFTRTHALRVTLSTDPVEIVRQGRGDGFGSDREQLL